MDMIRTIFIAFLMLISTTMFAQVTVNCPSMTVNPGDNISLDITVDAFVGIVSMQYSVNWDPAVLQFTSISNINSSLNGLVMSNFGTPPSTNPGVITQSWIDSNLSGVTVPDGTVIYTINFSVIGSPGGSSLVEFTDSPTPREASNDQGNLVPIDVNNGTITLTGTPPAGGPLVLTIDDNSSATGALECVDVTCQNFNDLLSMQYSVTYDQTVLQFNSIPSSSINLVDFDTNSYGDLGNGVLTISWNDISSGAGVTVPDNTVLFSICFDVIGGGGSSSPVDIGGTPTPIEVTSTTTGDTNLGINPTNGSVTVTGTGGTALTVGVGSDSGVNGSNVCVPVTVTNFTTIVSMDYSMNWDPTIVQFSGIQNLNLTDLSNANFNTTATLTNNGELTLEWDDSAGSGITVPDGTAIYEVCFDIIGSTAQSSAISVTSTPTTIAATQNDSGSIGPVSLVQQPGSIFVDGGSGGFQIIAANETAAPGSMVCVEYSVQAFTNILSMQYTMTYDPAQLQYDGPGTLSLGGLAASSFSNPNPGEIRISWLDPNVSGVTLANGTVIYELCFTVLGANGTTTPLGYVDQAPGFPIEIVDGDSMEVPFGSSSGSVTIDDGSGGGGLMIPDCPATSGFRIDAGAVTAATGTQICVPFSAANFNNVVSMQYVMTYDPTLLQYDAPGTLILNGLNNSSFSNPTAGQVRVSWLDPNVAGVTLPADSELYEICFTVLGANCTIANIGFTDAPGFPIEIVDGNGSEITSDFCNGGVIIDDGTCDNTVEPPMLPECPATANFRIDAPAQIVTTGTQICVPYTAQNFNNVVSMQYVMTYDPAVLQYDSPGTLNLNGLNNSSFSNPVAGQVRVSWLDPNVAGVTIPSPTDIYELCFTVIGANCTSSAMSFTSAAGFPIEIVDGNGSEITQDFCDGLILVDDGTCDPTMGTPPSIDPSASTITDIACAGLATGAIDLVVTGDPTLTYAWNNGADTEDLSNLPAGTYIVTVTNSEGSDSATFTVSQPSSAISAALNTITNASGSSTADGAIDIDVTGGTAGYTYAWTGGVTSQDLSNVLPGNYSVTITDANGCSTNLGPFTISVDIEIPPSGVTITDVNCFGDNTGSIDITVNGGTTPYGFAWSNGASTEDISGLVPGAYTVTVTDAVGGTAAGTYNVNGPSSALNASLISVTDVTVAGGSDGAIDINVSGGTPGYTFSWSNTGNTEDLGGLQAGMYSVTVTDQNGCSEELGPFTVNDGITPISIDAFNSTFTDVTCFGVNDGSINLVVSGGAAPVTYAWSNGAMTEDISGLAPGAYTVTVTDGNSTTDNATFTISGPTSGVSIAIDNVMHENPAGSNNGVVDITVSGGTAPYSYNWSNGFTMEDISGLAPGLYNLTVTDANSCEATISVTINAGTNTLEIDGANTVVNNVACIGENTGSINLVVSGGVTPYMYAWNNFVTTSNNSGLAAGTYTVTVTDAVGNTADDSFTITAPSSGVSVSVTNVINQTPSGNDGAVDIAVTGGTPGYTFFWNNTFTSQNISGLTASTYCVTVTDAAGCTASTCATVEFENNVDPLIIDGNNSVVTPVLCNGANTGAIDLVFSGGMPPYTFAWNNGFTVEDISGLAAGVYDVTIFDALGNQAVGSFLVTEPSSPVTVSVTSVTDETAPAAMNGSITVSASGGTPSGTGYTYAWSPNVGSTATVSNLGPGGYTVTVTDNNGCTAVTSGTVNSTGTPLAIDGNVTQAICFGDNSGGIDLVVTGGLPPYNFLWDPNGETTEDIVGLTVGSYTVTVTDAAGTTDTGTFFVGQPATAIVANVVTVTAESVAGNSDGAIDINVSGGTPPYDFMWSNGQTMEDASGLAGGGASYTVTISDSNDCQTILGPTTVSTDDLGVTIDPSNSSVTDIECFGDGSGAIDLEVIGGCLPYTYNWSNGWIAEDQQNLNPGTYSVTVTDCNGNTDEASFTVSQPASDILITIDGSTDPNCLGSMDGTINISLSGGTPGYTYLWTNGETTEDLTGLEAGNYVVTVTDANGCTAVSNGLTLSGTSGIEISGTATPQTPNLAGTITTMVTGGVAPFAYEWLPAGTETMLNNLIAGTYQVTVTDSNGCTDSETFVVEYLLDDVVIISIDPAPASCVGECSGSIDIEVAGGLPPYFYSWGNGDTFEDLIDLCAGDYQVTVTDQLGTTATASTTVSEPNSSLAIMDAQVNCETMGNDGSINIIVIGGTPGYDYEWSNGETTQDITGLTAGTYSVIITDINGCVVFSPEYEVCNMPPVPCLNSAFSNVEDANCAGGEDGAINITVGCIVPGQILTYDWTGPNSFTSDQEDISGLEVGFYTLVVTDNFGQSFTEVFEVTAPQSMTMLEVTINEETCLGFGDGSINITVTGGAAPYDYIWNNGEDTEDIVDLDADFSPFSVTITDTNGCVFISNNYVLEHGAPCINNAQTVVNHVTCAGENDGSIDLEVIGDDGTYTYSWVDSGTPPFTASTQDISSLPAGDYTVTITSIYGTSTVASYTVNGSGTQVSATSIVTPASTGNDGAIDITPEGGTGSYIFEWSDDSGVIADIEDLNGLSPGNYSVVVTDSNGCTYEESFTIDGIILLMDNITDENCEMSNDGTISITVSGNGPFNYAWVGPNGFTADTEDITDLDAGQYTITIIDVNGMSMDQMFTVDTGSGLTGSIFPISGQTANGACDASIGANGTNGQGTYTYEWSTGFIGETLENLCMGTYSVTITDDAGCEVIEEYVIVDPVPGTSNAVVTQTTCPDECDGAIVAVVEGDLTPPFTYIWSNGETTQTITGLCPGNYTCTITDANNLTPEIINVDILEKEPIEITFEDYNDTGLQTVVTGGTEPYRYSWNTQDTTSFTNNLVPDEYSVVVSDANGCTSIGRSPFPLSSSLDDCFLSRKAITPNLDGKNDNFIITCVEDFENTLEIYNRWGQLVHLATNYDNSWEGTDQSGDLLPEGGYFYVLKYTSSQGESKQLKGYVTVIRQ